MSMDFNPQTIMSDFEPALAEAISGEVGAFECLFKEKSYLASIQLSTCDHLGCYYHFTQAVYRKIQSLGLSNKYDSDEDIRVICRKLMALPLMPLTLVSQSFDDLFDVLLQGSSSTYDSLKPLFEYFEHYWMKTLDPKRWNVYGLKMRTNNNAEGT